MDKIKQEFWLAIIFVGKWLTIGLGGLGILYFAIYLAYHKSYFDPRMDKFDLEKTELIESKNGLEKTKTSLIDNVNSISDKLDEIDTKLLPTVDNRIQKVKLKIKGMGAKCLIIKINPFPEKNKDKEEICKELEKIENEKVVIIENQRKLKEEHSDFSTSVANITKEINKYNSDIEKVELKKRRAEVDVKGPLIWLASVLGLT